MLQLDLLEVDACPSCDGRDPDCVHCDGWGHRRWVGRMPRYRIVIDVEIGVATDDEDAAYNLIRPFARNLMRAAARAELPDECEKHVDWHVAECLIESERHPHRREVV